MALLQQLGRMRLHNPVSTNIVSEILYLFTEGERSLPLSLKF